MTGPPLEVRDLAHVYETEPALAVDELELGPGRVHLAGPNGAGKTTLLQVLATLRSPTRGTAAVLGHDVRTEGRRVRAITGYAGHQPSLHDALPARATLRLHADLHGAGRGRADEALSGWGLDAVADRPAGACSRGQRARLDLARALLHRPRVLLLDEPAAGLDRAGLATLEERLSALAPELVLVAAPDDPGIAVDGSVRLEAGRVEAVER